jgi:hypothetical protein
VRHTIYVALRSALEDFEGVSLEAIPGLLGKLRYLGELHDGRGNYSHWGIARVHGELAARRAIRASHVALMARVLRTPLRMLVEDLSSSANRGQLTPREFLLSLEMMQGHVQLEHFVGASDRHFKAVLHALSALLQGQGNPAALQPPRFDR